MKLHLFDEAVASELTKQQAELILDISFVIKHSELESSFKGVIHVYMWIPLCFYPLLGVFSVSALFCRFLRG